MSLRKIKRPQGDFWFDFEAFAEDEDGFWLRGPVGTPWRAPHATGSSEVPVVVLLAPGRPWAAWWVGDPADRRLEIDVCRPPERDGNGWQYVDLELDPVLHETEGRVEIEDWDEYDESVRNGWMTADDAKLARVVAEGCAQLLHQRSEPWLDRGWKMLPDS
ncbi:DUF402 domain-containing protein [Actinoplanes sp. LDG1-06]|uniref:DUF402 domain-containing protein n=1 Tax=Paractinoplanes ovalisporus TaxID=2810368 RepID=A0ABS2AVD8_9ACTN|nr:DUF402 domain-containing protein [Actinoplanes ovalisporus]MBM2623791.1 DUF402 domain-containing protein [Actinoplanes ovalisporus]